VYPSIYDVGPVSYSTPTSLLESHLTSWRVSSWGLPKGSNVLGNYIVRINPFNATYFDMASQYYAADP
jgi:hypothetical protein